MMISASTRHASFTLMLAAAISVVLTARPVQAAVTVVDCTDSVLSTGFTGSPAASFSGSPPDPTVIGSACSHANVTGTASSVRSFTGDGSLLFNLTLMAEASRAANPGGECAVVVHISHASFASGAQLGVVGTNDFEGCSVSVKIEHTSFTNGLLYFADLQLSGVGRLEVRHVTTSLTDIKRSLNNENMDYRWPIVTYVVTRTRYSFWRAPFDALITTAASSGIMRFRGSKAAMVISDSTFSLDRQVDWGFDASGFFTYTAASALGGYLGSFWVVDGGTFLETSNTYTNVDNRARTSTDFVYAMSGRTAHFRCRQSKALPSPVCVDDLPRGRYVQGLGSSYLMANLTVDVRRPVVGDFQTYVFGLLNSFEYNAFTNVTDSGYDGVKDCKISVMVAGGSTVNPVASSVAAISDNFRYDGYRIANTWGIRETVSNTLTVTISGTVFVATGLGLFASFFNMDTGAVETYRGNTINIEAPSMSTLGFIGPPPVVSAAYIGALDSGTFNSDFSTSTGASFRFVKNTVNINAATSNVIVNGFRFRANSWATPQVAGQPDGVVALVNNSIFLPSGIADELFTFLNSGGRPSIEGVAIRCIQKTGPAWADYGDFFRTATSPYYFTPGTDRVFVSGTPTCDRDVGDIPEAWCNETYTPILCTSLAYNSSDSISSTVEWDATTNTCRCNCRRSLNTSSAASTSVATFDPETCAITVTQDRITEMVENTMRPTATVTLGDPPAPSTRSGTASLTASLELPQMRSPTISKSSLLSHSPSLSLSVGGRTVTPQRSMTPEMTATPPVPTNASNTTTEAPNTTTTTTTTAASGTTTTAASGTTTTTTTAAPTTTTTAASGTTTTAAGTTTTAAPASTTTTAASPGTTTTGGTPASTTSTTTTTTAAPPTAASGNTTSAAPSTTSPRPTRTITATLLPETTTTTGAPPPPRTITHTLPETPTTTSTGTTTTNTTTTAAPATTPAVGPSPPGPTRTLTQTQSLPVPTTPAPTTEEPTPAPNVTLNVTDERVLAAPMEATTNAAAAASMAMGLAAPGAILQMARVLGAMGIADLCSISPIEKRREAAMNGDMKFPRSFFPWLHIGHDRGKRLRGTIIANILGVIAFGVIAGIISVIGALMKFKPRSEKTAKEPYNIQQKALRFARFPGTLVLVGIAGMSGSLTSGIFMFSLNWMSESPGPDIGLGVLSILVHISFAALIVFAIWTFNRGATAGESLKEGGDMATSICLRDKVAYVPCRMTRKSDNTPVEFPQMLRKPLKWTLYGGWQWLPPAEGIEGESYFAHVTEGHSLLETYGPVVNRYRNLPPDHLVAPKCTIKPKPLRLMASMCPWYLIVEMLLSMIMCVAEGLTVVNCDLSVALAMMSTFLGLMSFAILRPYTIPLRNGLGVVINFLTFVCMNVIVAGLSEPPGVERADKMQLASRIAFGAAAFALLGVAANALNICVMRWYYKAHMVVDRSRLKGAEGVSFATMLDDVEELELLANQNPIEIMDDENTSSGSSGGAGAGGLLNDPLLGPGPQRQAAANAPGDVTNPRAAAVAAAVTRPAAVVHSPARSSAAAPRRILHIDTSSEDDSGGISRSTSLDSFDEL